MMMHLVDTKDIAKNQPGDSSIEQEKSQSIQSLSYENSEKESDKIISDVDTDIPVNKTRNPNSYALIIGNEDYKSYQTSLKTEQNVDFAINDASSFKLYCENIFGIPEQNIIFETNAGVVKMNQGLNKINSVIKNTDGNATVIVYYAGHGYPHEKTKETYLIPVDVPASNLDMAISLNKMIEKLTEYPSQKVVVMLDACFTGGGRNEGLLSSRGVKIIPKESKLQGNIVIFHASSSDQSALAYSEKRHGIFTYYLLKKLKETKGKTTFGELFQFVKSEVSIRSPLINNAEQNPEISISKKVADDWEEWLINQ
jgi:hypothetical protein